MGVNTKILKANIETTFNINKFINCIKDEKDPIEDFKNELEKLIKEISNKKLVLIIDELDRCRPDYAMKVLEVAKHFFDIKGLVIIFFANKKALYNSIKALYNFDNNDTNGEDYISKFFTERIQLNPIDYEKYIIDCLASRLEFKTKTTKNNLTEKNDKFCSLHILKNSLVELSKNNQISCRELNGIISKIIEFYEKRKDADDNDWEYIVNEIFYKYFNRVLGRKIYNSAYSYADNINTIKLFDNKQKENIFYYNSFSKYLNKKHDILNPKYSYEEILNSCNISQFYTRDLYSRLINNKREIFFCFCSPINLSERIIDVRNFKHYFELAKERDEILKSYDKLKSDKIEELKGILSKYDKEVESFKNMYIDTDNLTEEDFNRRKVNIDNTIKEIFLIN